MDAYAIKQRITETNIIQVIKSLGGELAYEQGDCLIFTSITYSINANEHKPKLYYYKSSKGFVEYHTGMDSFDIFDVVKYRKQLLGEEYSFYDCIKYVCNVLGFDYSFKTNATEFKQYVNAGLSRFLPKKGNSIIEDDIDILNNDLINALPFDDVYHQSWIDDHISIESMEKYNIKYYEYGGQIIIPCYNRFNQLIGIRARNLNPYSSYKYIPYSSLDGREYSFPTGSTLFGLNHTMESIKRHKKVIICESEKSVLQGDTYFGDNNIIVGMYGSALTKEKRNLILSLGIDEVIIAIDFDYDEVRYHNEDLYEDLTDWERYESKVNKICAMFKDWCKVSVIVDEYPKHKKDCVTDYGREEFLRLYKQRITLTED